MMKVLLSSAYLAPVEYYAWMLAADEVLLEQHDHYVKQTYRNRCTIATADGPLSLTVPIVKPETDKCEMKDIRISDHGNWRHLHWGALFSSYGKSPFFDYIANDLQHIIADGEQKSLLDLNMELHRLIVDFMDLSITTTVVTTEQEVDEALQHGALDLRGKVGLKRGDRLTLANVPYYQMWSQRRGSFTPALSILDLLMNEGREGIFTLLKMSEDSSIL